MIRNCLSHQSRLTLLASVIFVRRPCKLSGGRGLVARRVQGQVRTLPSQLRRPEEVKRSSQPPFLVIYLKVPQGPLTGLLAECNYRLSHSVGIYRMSPLKQSQFSAGSLVFYHSNPAVTKTRKLPCPARPYLSLYHCPCPLWNRLIMCTQLYY